jgi:hypothetical protein
MMELNFGIFKKKVRPENKHKIVLYNMAWGMEEGKGRHHAIADGFEFSTDHQDIEEAAALIFHMPTLPKGDKMLDRSKKKKGQLWVFWSMECEAHRAWQYEPEILSLFDIFGTYNMDSDIPVPYIYPVHRKILRNKPSLKSEFVNAFISSTYDRSHRVKYLKELMSYIDVHSYGKVLNNRSMAEDKGDGTKKKIMSKYKFSIAFENARAKDYVTEKFFDPLIMGSIPIYLGAPNVEEFAPGEHCYIHVDSFSSVKALADWLLELGHDKARYDEYMAWKKLPFRDAFIKKMDVVKEHSLIRLCQSIRMRMQA